MRLNLVLKDIFKIFDANNIEAYLVGGYVRDSLLKIKSYDCDFCVDCDTTKLLNLFSAYHPQLSGLDLLTISFKIKNYNIDITPFRLEADYLKRRKPQKVSITHNIKEDIVRRDFTINTILYHPKQKYLDYCGGLIDLKNRCIKTVIDPYVSFERDSLRMFRALYLKSKLAFEFEENTLRALNYYSSHLKYLSNYRKHQEFMKLLMTDNFIAVLKQHKNIFNQLFKLEIPDTKLYDFPLSLYRMAYLLAFQDNEEIFKELNFNKKDLKLINELAYLTKLNIDDELVFIEFFNFKNNYLFYLKYLSSLHNADVYKNYHRLKKRIVLRLRISGNDILKLGYQNRDIEGIKSNLISLINKGEISNNKCDLIKFLTSKKHLH